jgi:hypothetical protein
MRETSSARAELRRVVHLMADGWTPEATTDERTDRIYNAIRAEAFAEAEAKAREVVARLWGGGLTQAQLDRTDGARAVELELGQLAAAPAPSDPGSGT